jgi:hypothetical protein
MHLNEIKVDIISSIEYNKMHTLNILIIKCKCSARKQEKLIKYEVIYFKVLSNVHCSIRVGISKPLKIVQATR